jgi:hypothetical protein
VKCNKAMRGASADDDFLRRRSALVSFSNPGGAERSVEIGLIKKKRRHGGKQVGISILSGDALSPLLYGRVRKAVFRALWINRRDSMKFLLVFVDKSWRTGVLGQRSSRNVRVEPDQDR